jgi:hypothetical protein
MPDQKTISSTSQDFLDIYDITNDIVILKNGSASVVLSVNAMNFGLLAEQEQDAVIYSYAGLLNSINYPIQILIQSQTKDASSYLKLLEKREEKTKDEIKRAWIRRYSKFVNDLIKERNVLDKKFFVIIPASSLEMSLTPAQNIASGFKEQSIEGIEKSVILEKAQNLLEPKKDHLIAQFNRIGLYARQLSTQEIIRLFYTNYNPGATEGQQITNSQSYTTSLVQAQIRGDYMDDKSQNPLEPTQANQPVAPSGDAQAPMAPPTPAATPSVPVEPTQPNEAGGDLAKDVNIAESPVLQKPMAAGSTPMPAPNKPVTPAMTPPAAAPMTPPSPMASGAPAVEPGSVEITKPDSMTKAPVEPAMPQPAQPMVTPTPSTMPQAPVVDTATQENINSTLDQMTEKSTK